jgi:predicted RNase H-like HicB family nuclease
MILTYSFVVFTDPEDSSKWIAEVPGMPGARSWGATKEEALRHGQDALETVLEHLQSTGHLRNAEAIPVVVHAA